MILQTFNEVQKLLSKTNGQVIGDLMTPAPVVVRETTNLEDAARFFLFPFPQHLFLSSLLLSLYMFSIPDYWSRRSIGDSQL